MICSYCFGMRDLSVLPHESSEDREGLIEYVRCPLCFVLLNTVNKDAESALEAAVRAVEDFK